MQSKNRDTDEETKCMDTKTGGGAWEDLRAGVDIYTLLILWVIQVTNENRLQSTGSSAQCSVAT